MPTAVFVHPHPDDEAIFSGGAICRAAQAGWHVVLVLATSGEEGEMPDWVEVDAADHRRMETAVAAAELGVGEVHHLGYRDSGMAGTAANAAPGTLATSVHEATADLAALLVRVGADAVVGQDPGGIYGHPDHVAVHHVVRGAADAAGTPELIEATLDRDWLLAHRQQQIAAGRLSPDAWCAAELAALGVSGAAVAEAGAALLHLELTSEVGPKQAAMAAHASQVPHARDFMGIPPGTFHRVIANEWYLPVRPTDGPGRLGRLLVG